MKDLEKLGGGGLGGLRDLIIHEVHGEILKLGLLVFSLLGGKSYLTWGLV